METLDLIPPEDPSSHTESGWKTRIQQVSLRTKIIVPIVALAVIPTIALGILTISQTRKVLLQGVVERCEIDTLSKGKRINDYLLDVRKDLLILANSSAILALAEMGAEGKDAPTALIMKNLEKGLIDLYGGQRVFCQVAFLNAMGLEVVRYVVSDGRPERVPSLLLEDVDVEQDVFETMALEPGHIRVWPVTIAVEDDDSKKRSLRAIRYATTILGPEGRSKGLLVVTVESSHLLSLTEPLMGAETAWLIDSGGRYKHYPVENEDERLASGMEQERKLSEYFSDEQIQSIALHHTVQRAGDSNEAVFFSTPISIGPSVSDRNWTLLLRHPNEVVKASVRQLSVFLSIALTFVVALAAMLGAMMGDYFVRPIERLRQATRKIAGGDLATEVLVETGDEIEDLAADFNTMTKQLRHAQQQLASWNENLEHEVARQTRHMHRLEAGLAKADKLASIGQIAASVMHEVGNPLAAIKTKIQVAEEESGFNPEHDTLFAEILDEVDRLAAFLRSFSRLSRLRESNITEGVSLVEIVEHTVALFRLDLKKKGVTLRYRTDQNVPMMRGDADQLRHLLMNLILNAADASRGTGEVIVEVWYKESAPQEAPYCGTMGFCVVDSGTGISPEVLKKIWNPFFTTKRDGTGLGLAVCRQIVEEHGGAIHISSSPGKRTVVSVSFPAKVAKREKTARSGDTPEDGQVEH